MESFQEPLIRLIRGELFVQFRAYEPGARPNDARPDVSTGLMEGGARLRRIPGRASMLVTHSAAPPRERSGRLDATAARSCSGRRLPSRPGSPGSEPTAP